MGGRFQAESATREGVSGEPNDILHLLSLMKIEVSRHFNAPIEAVWALLSDVERMAGLGPEHVEAHWLGQERGAGAQSAERIGAAMMFGWSRVMSPSARVRPGSLGRSSNPRILHHDGATRWKRKARAHSSWSGSSTDRTTASPVFGRKSTPPTPYASSANERTPCERT
jgi:hypothetical protein